MPPSAPPSLLRFVAHLLLFLQALLPDGLRVDTFDELTPTH